MIDVFSDEYCVAINAYDHRESIKKAIFSWKANNDVEINIDKEDDTKQP